MDKILFSSLPLEQLKTELSDAVFKQFEPFLHTAKSQTLQTEIINRKEAAKLLGVSLVTLNQWTKEGRVKGYRIASRVRYKKVELENSLTQIKTGR